MFELSTPHCSCSLGLRESTAGHALCVRRGSERVMPRKILLLIFLAMSSNIGPKQTDLQSGMAGVGPEIGSLGGDYGF